MKFLREGREGPPMSFKTGAIACTYPKPMLALMFQPTGLSVVPPKGTPTPPGGVPTDTFYEDIVFIKPTEFAEWAAKPREQQPRILAIQFTDGNLPFKMEPGIVPDSKPITGLMNVLNEMGKVRETPPWATIMFDNTSHFQEAMLASFAEKNAGIMNDARQWAPNVGDKVRQVAGALFCMNAHVVVIIHTTSEKHELTSVVNELPDVYGGIRENLSKMFDQFFYATKDSTGKPMVWTTDQMAPGGNLRGIGAKWPSGLPSKCGASFSEIYGKELK